MKKRPLPNLDVFLAIAEQGSLRAAARAMGVGPPAVSQQLKSLEALLGTSLFTRTTRSVHLTDAGKLLLSKAGPAYASLDEAISEVKGVARTDRGTVRITLPYGAFRLAFVPRLSAFRDAYPRIELAFSIEETFVDLLSEHFHAGVRLGDTIHEDMIAVRLTPPLNDAFFASPSYLAKHGTPAEPADLLQHNCINYRYKSSHQLYPWRFMRDGRELTVDVSGTVVVDSFEAAMEAARQGIGIAQNFRQEIERDLESKRLETVLDGYALERPGFYLYYPREYSKLGILRRLIDFLKA
jgi:DNA-binding transcriptional LysR family regulator